MYTTSCHVPVVRFTTIHSKKFFILLVHVPSLAYGCKKGQWFCFTTMQITLEDDPTCSGTAFRSSLCSNLKDITVTTKIGRKRFHKNKFYVQRANFSNFSEQNSNPWGLCLLMPTKNIKIPMHKKRRATQRGVRRAHMTIFAQSTRPF